ncbi:MAG TPA: hypothetical protein VEI07_22540, partial [Planctomycetaceae bacterium]|nr:hypothetical protein [Planctomycetaceae bacterium]
MAHFTRHRRSGNLPGRKRGGWQLVALAVRLVVVIFVVAVCLTRWGPAQERTPKSSPATAAQPKPPASAAPTTPPPPVESNVPVRTGEEAASQPPSDQSPSGGPAAPAAKPAKAHRTIPTRPLEIIEALGVPFIIAFGVCSVIAVWFSIERLVVLRRGRVIPRPFVERF